jgi:hypothetical protein
VLRARHQAELHPQPRELGTSTDLRLRRVPEGEPELQGAMWQENSHLTTYLFLKKQQDLPPSRLNGQIALNN